MTFTHKRKDYRITAIKLKYPMALTLEGGLKIKGEVGDYFVSDEEGEQYFITAAKMEKDFVGIGFFSVSFAEESDVPLPPNRMLLSDKPLTPVSFDPSRYSAH